ncbi:6-carboxytetrahydropterin synthase [bacterium]|nr:6-carboxytetrahydropterin synthase [bacterium]
MSRMLLKVPLELRAKHSLEERENFHGHVWRITVAVTGPLEDGRIASLPALQAELDQYIAPLQDTVLNSHPQLDDQTRATPTCECLALYLEKQFAKSLRKSEWEKLRLTEIEVAVDELDGEQTGSAVLVF